MQAVSRDIMRERSKSARGDPDIITTGNIQQLHRFAGISN